MKQTPLNFLLRTAIVLFGIVGFCGLGSYAGDAVSLSMLVTPGCLLLAFGLYRLDEQLCGARRKRYKVCRRRIHVAPSSGPMRAA